MSKYVIHESIYSKKTDEVWLVLDPSKSSYLEMNDVAGIIWEELQSPITPEEIATKLSTEYDVTYDEALKDVQEFVRTYLKRKFLKQVE